MSEQSKILTKTQVEQFEQLAAGPDKGENIINYYERLAKVLEEVGYKADEAYGGAGRLPDSGRRPGRRCH